MKESWKPYPMFCPNCGRLNYGYKSEDNSVFVNKKVLQKGVKKVSTFNTQ